MPEGTRLSSVETSSKTLTLGLLRVAGGRGRWPVRVGSVAVAGRPGWPWPVDGGVRPWPVAGNKNTLLCHGVQVCAPSLTFKKFKKSKKTTHFSSQPKCDGSGGLKGAATKSKHGATCLTLRMNEVGSGPMGEREHEVTCHLREHAQLSHCSLSLLTLIAPSTGSGPEILQDLCQRVHSLQPSGHPVDRLLDRTDVHQASLVLHHKSLVK